MSEDIVQQANLRRQRRPRTAKDPDPALFQGDTPKQPPHRLADLHASSEGPDDESSLVTRTSGDSAGRPRTPRNRTNANFSTLAIFDGSESVPSLPFIKCQVYDLEVRALIDTSRCRSAINKRLQEKLGSPRQTKNVVAIEIEGENFNIRPELEDGGPDISLAMDFLTHHRCELNFVTRTLTVGDGIRTSLLSERDVPFSYRTSASLASSI